MVFGSLEDLFEHFNQLKILILGDVMVDSYVWGSVTRISPEAPVPIVRVNKREMRLGGAANVALNIQSLGAKPILCSVIGEDQNGDSFLELLENQGIESAGIVKSKDRITTVKERVMSGSQHIVRIDNENDNELNENEQHYITDRFHKLAKGIDAIVFQDYDKGNLTPHLIKQFVTFARQLNIPTIVDPKKRNFHAYRQTSLFKPNLKEIKEGLKLDFDARDSNQLEEAVNLLIKDFQLQNALITLSDQGVYIDGEGGRHHIPAHLRSISDVSGAGDTVVSIASLCAAAGLSNKLLASLANLGGGLVCEHLGVVPVNKHRLLEEAKKSVLF